MDTSTYPLSVFVRKALDRWKVIRNMHNTEVNIQGSH